MLDLISNFRKNIFNGFKDEEIEKIEDFWTILEKCDIEYDNSKMLDFIQLVFQKCEAEASNECVTYDLSLPYEHQDLIIKYKNLVNELNPKDVPTTAAALKHYSDEFFEELLATGNQLAVMVNTKTKGNKDSIFKTFIADGYKTNADSMIIDFIPVGLYDGYQNYEQEFSSSINGRIAGIINADVIERVGYVTRKLGFMMKFTKLDGTHEDHSCEPSLDIFINDDNIDKFTGRNYKENGNILHLTFDSPRNKYYKLFSPMGCKSTGKHVCKTCFGKLSDNLSHLETLGTISQPITQDVTQSLLSSKHFSSLNLPTHPDVTYLGYFDGDPKWQLRQNSLLVIDEEGNLIDENGSVVPFMTRELKWLDEDKQIFNGDGNFYNKNTKSLVGLFEEIFNKTRSFSSVNTFEDYLKGMLKFDNIAGLGENSILWELILMNMCRNKNDLRKLAKELPDEEYEICSLQKAILKSGSMDALFFERFKEQVSSPSFYLEPLDRKGYGEFYFGKEKRKNNGVIKRIS